MKKQIELACFTCGKKFIAEADYILPGVSGWCVNKVGKTVTFLDPTEEHHCEECIRKAIEEAKKGAINVD